MSLENWQRAGFGIYVHWPFCAAKCPYCDFNSHVSSTIDYKAFESAYLSEIGRYSEETPGRVVSSIFFGGGTPSLMPPRIVASIIEMIAERWSISNHLEVTLEANPTSVDVTSFSGFRAAGVNRVSIGIQALNDNDLSRLGRLHTAKDALKAVETAQSIFDRSSFDLIYGRQDQSVSDWSPELELALSLGTNHISLYQLTIEAGTAFADRLESGGLKGLPDEDRSADLYEFTQEICESAGLRNYEVSNHSVIGHECRHNLIYWNSGDYVGIGPGAHGRLSFGEARYATACALAPVDWLTRVSNGRAEVSRELLSQTDVSREAAIMGLRLTDGVAYGQLSQMLKDEELNRALTDGLLTHHDGNIKTTKRGRLLLNTLVSNLVD